MSIVRIALANLSYPDTPETSVALAEAAIREGAGGGAQILCFPECFLPGYRGMGKTPPPPDPDSLEQAWARIASAAGAARLAVVMGTERIVDGGLRITALVINADGTTAGFQDKVQLDPSEEGTYTPAADGTSSRLGRSGSGLPFAMRAGVTRRPCAGPRNAAHMSYSTRT